VATASSGTTRSSFLISSTDTCKHTTHKKPGLQITIWISNAEELANWWV
jgi:hypothetical protein